MLDFPASPTNGQKFPQPAVPGVPVYTWDGEKWTTAGGEIVTATPATALPLMDAKTAVVGTTLKYAREDHVHPTDTTFFASEMAYSGMQINGGMEVSQELGATSRATPGYVCDGWGLSNSSTAGITAQTSTGSIIQGLPSFLNTTVTAAQASLTTTQSASFYQFIEGYRTSRLAWGTGSPQPITISFWTAHARTGTYSVAIRNGSDNRSYVTTYTQNAADTWEYKTVTIPGDTTGTWSQFNTTGMLVQFAMASGPTYTAPAANTWYGALYVAAPGQVNAVAATSDRFRLSGVTILPGTQAPTAAQSPNIMRPYDQELVTCMRYYRRTTGEVGTEITVLNGYAQAAGNAVGHSLIYPVPMRTAPTITTSGTWVVSNCGQPLINGINATSYSFYAVAAATGAVTFQPNNSGIVKFDARL